MELLKNLEGLTPDEQMTAVVELQKAAMQHLEEQKQASIGKSAELVIQGLKKIKSDFEESFNSLNYDIQTKVASLKDGEQGLQGPKGDQGERGLDGSNGRDGRDGKDGKDGVDGVDGVGVRDAKIDFDGSLVISLTDGREINCGEVVSVDVAKQIQKVTHNIQTGAGGDSQTVLDAIAALQATIATYGTMATQNANNVAITGGNINNTVIGGTTPVAGTFTTLTANSTSQFGRSSANYLQAVGASSGAGPAISSQGSDANIDINATSKGSGSFKINNAGGTVAEFNDGGASSPTNGFLFAAGSGGIRALIRAMGGPITLLSTGATAVNFSTNGSSGNIQASVSHTASAVNYVQVTGAATNNNVKISAQGSDANVWIDLQTKGYGAFAVKGGGGAILFNAVGTSDATRNYPQVESATSAFTPTFSVQGSSTNIPLLVQSKGTGAIDLAAGSSGVNISNGGTVTAIMRTASGSNYTSIPSVAITAPTTAGGVQATATVALEPGTITVASGGTGYTLNDVLTFVGGTIGSQSAQITVTGVSGGVITSVSQTRFGRYTALPTNPISVTGGTGTGATFNVTAYVVSPEFTITNAGSGYVEQPTVTFSGGGGSGAAAYATVGSTPIIKALASNVSFSNDLGEVLRLSNNTGTTTQPAYLQITNSASSTVGVYGQGAASTVAISFISKNTGAIVFSTGSTSGNQQFQVAHTASAVNYVQVTGAATGGVPTISMQGSDSNITMRLQYKGNGGIQLSNAAGWAGLTVTAANNPNSIALNAPAAGSAPTLTAQGSDTNIDLALTPKGTGALVAQASDGTTINARGANAVDLQTARGAASQVASGQYSVILGGYGNTANSYSGTIAGGISNTGSGPYSGVLSGILNTASNYYSISVGGQLNVSGGWYNFIGGGFTNSGTANAAVTTQSGTMNGTTAVTLSGSNANIKVGQYITGTSIAIDTYVAAISGTSLTLSKNASGSSTSTLSFYTPHGVVVGGGNNQATGAYSFIGGGGDAGTAANRNVASGAWSTVAGGWKNTASGLASFIGGGGTYDGVNGSGNVASGIGSFVASGWGNNASSNAANAIGVGNVANGQYSTVIGYFASAKGITGNVVFGANSAPLGQGANQSAILVLAKQTTDATATVITSDGGAAATSNQVILPNNSAYYFRGEVVSGVTGGGNTKGWFIEGVIKRGANAASTALVGTPTVTSNYADAGASTWTIAVTADTTNGGLAVTFTGQASTTIRTVAQIRTTEMTY